MSIDERVRVWLPDIDDGLLEELIKTATDRIKLRVGEKEFPEELKSIAVEVVRAMYNRKYHAGVKNENADTFSISFVDDLLQEYELDFQRYLEMKKKEENPNRGVIRFL